MQQSGGFLVCSVKVAYWSKMARNVIESDFRSSKIVAGSHVVNQRKVAYWSEMARNSIESDFRSSKMVAGSHFVNKLKINKSCVLIRNGEKFDRMFFSVIQNGRLQPFREKKSKEIKVAHWSEMARNAIESDFRSSKMAASSHFVNKILTKKLHIDLKWREIRSKVIFGHPKWLPAAILWNEYNKIKVAYWSEMARNAIKSDFRSSKMAAGSHFLNKIKINKNWILIWNGEKCDRKWFSVIQNGGGGEAPQWPACKPFGDIHQF